MLDSKKQTELDNERLYAMLAEYKDLLKQCKKAIDEKADKVAVKNVVNLSRELPAVKLSSKILD